MLTIEYDKGKLRSLVTVLADSQRVVGAQLKIAVTASVLDVQSQAAINSPYRRGVLRKSISHKVESSSNETVGFVGSNLEYARIQELGGQTGRNHATTIRPKRYLTRSIESNKQKISARLNKLKIVNR